MRAVFNIFALVFFLVAVVFAGFGVWIVATDNPLIGVLVLFCAACCGFLGEGCRGVARREPVVVKIPPYER